MSNSILPSSFRDPAGFLFEREGILYRQVNLFYKDNYDLLINSRLYQKLVSEKLLVSHSEVKIEPADEDKVYKIIQPERIDFISYPYEWCFSQLKDAALLTLKIQKLALDHGMSLKDCSTYNIQFQAGKPIFIDTLSFERYQEGKPWVAYRQFCQHFLAPLVLMSYQDIRLSQLLRIYLDGIPLDLTSQLLPLRTRFFPSILTHIHLHAGSQKRYAEKRIDVSRLRLGRMALLGIIDNLEKLISHLKWSPRGTEWADYYREINYTPEAFEHKKKIVAEMLAALKPAKVWDMGANTGIFSRIASRTGARVISPDSDPAAVELNYLECKNKQEENILPLVIDLTNPSPCTGWENRERMSLIERGPVDTVLALALIHHLAISNNLPLSRIAEFFSKICRSLIIEFVPKSDSQVQRLLATREDIFPNYTREGFEKAFKEYFHVEDPVQISGSERTIYLMHRIAK